MHSISSEAALSYKNKGRLRGSIQTFVFADSFVGAVFLITASNVVVLGVEADYRARDVNQDQGTALHVLEVIQAFYTLIFVSELLLRVWAEGCRFWCNSQRYWNWFDTLIAMLSVLDTVVNSVGILSGVDKPLWLTQITNTLRPLRVLRVVRLISFIKEIRVLIHSILATLKALVWALLLMVFVMYSFSLGFTEAVREKLYHLKIEQNERPCSPDQDDAHILDLCELWGSVPKSIFTLFQTLTGGVDWADAIRPLVAVNWMLVVGWFAFFVFMVFILLNVMTAVFCQTAIEAAVKEDALCQEAEIACTGQLIKELCQVFSEVDRDQSGTIDDTEIEMASADPRIKAFFASRGMDSKEAWALFKLLDTDGTGRVDIESFVEGLLMYRGPARAIQLARVAHDCKQLKRGLEALAGHGVGNCKDIPTLQ